MSGRLHSRVSIVLAILVAGHLGSAGRQLHDAELAVPLAALPLELGGWRGVDATPYDEETLRVLGVDEHLNRVYVHPASAMVGLYVGYYRSQRQGDSIHSPRNCLPGSGWQPISHTRPHLDIAGRRMTVNRYIVERRGERQLVLYWFHGRGRSTVGEYETKAYMLLDALRSGRTNGAVIRVIAPFSTTQTERAVDEVAMEFLRSLVPPLTQWLP